LQREKYGGLDHPVDHSIHGTKRRFTYVGSVKALRQLEGRPKKARMSEVEVAEDEITAAGLGNHCSVLQL
jgi:hypothetical protein